MSYKRQELSIYIRSRERIALYSKRNKTTVICSHQTQSRESVHEFEEKLLTMKLLVVALLLFNFSWATFAIPKFRYEQEWGKWKLTNDRNYTSELEELERHLIWLSNKVYIDQHNANAHIFGFTLAMNHLGDLVSQL